MDVNEVLAENADLRTRNEELRMALKLAHDWIFRSVPSPMLVDVRPKVKAALGLPLDDGFRA